MKEIRVVELFAGVGGFRVGLEKSSKKYKVVWSNQWEPQTKAQHASDIYIKNFGSDNHSNQDIAKVDVNEIPDHDMLVGGVPCQDYSVAKTLSQSNGLEGKKGVLWWEIHRILNEKRKKPDFLILENVDRLLKSPVKQRGRDFSIMLSSLSDLGYVVEWRVINAADYGMPQRRRRVFLLGYRKGTKIYNEACNAKSFEDFILHQGIFANSFKAKRKDLITNKFELKGTVKNISDNFNLNKSPISPFKNSGLIIDRMVVTFDTTPSYAGEVTTLGDVLLPENDVPMDYFIDDSHIDKWKYLKGAKKEKRVNKATGFEYNYCEGGMVFPDAIDKPSRTIVTGEGGSSPSRFKHVVKCKESGKLRRLTPLELERLNMFPDNHTSGVSDVRRAFFMGNALVVGIIEKVGSSIIKSLLEAEGKNDVNIQSLCKA